MKKIGKRSISVLMVILIACTVFTMSESTVLAQQIDTPKTSEEEVLREENMVAPVANTPNPDADFEFNAATGTITKYVGPDGAVVIPDSIGGVPVTEIGETSFNYSRYRKTVTSIVLPTGLRWIGVSAFSGQAFTQIDFPDGLEVIETNAFLNCHKLEEVILPNSVRRLGESAFQQCEAVKRVVLSSRLTRIPSGCFSPANLTGSLEEVLFKEGLEVIGENAFAGQKLKDIRIPDSVYLIEKQAFASQQDRGQHRNIHLGSGIQRICAQDGSDGSIGNAFSGWTGRIIFPITRREADLRGADRVLTYDDTTFRVFYASDVYYELDGADSPPIPDDIVKYDELIENIPADPTKAGFIFTGWFTLYGSVFNFNTPIIEDLTIYAHWEAVSKFSVKYDTGFGDVVLPDKTDVIWDDSNLLPTTIPQKGGYNFIGWKLNGRDVISTDKYSDLTTDQTDGSSITLTAVWDELMDYSVSYNTNGGTFITKANTTVTGMKYKDVVQLPTPVREGYTFTGWTYKGIVVTGTPLYKELETDSTVKQITLEAQWKVNEYTVDYKFINQAPNSVTPPNGITLVHGTTVTDPAIVAPKDWAFDGWYLDEACTQLYNFAKPITGNMELFGKWTYQQPAVPPTPSEPEIPSTPTTPDKPVAPNAPTVSIPKTGDTTNVMMYASMLLVAGLSGLGLLVGRKRKSIKDNQK